MFYAVRGLKTRARKHLELIAEIIVESYISCYKHVLFVVVKVCVWGGNSSSYPVPLIFFFRTFSPLPKSELSLKAGGDESDLPWKLEY